MNTAPKRVTPPYLHIVPADPRMARAEKIAAEVDAAMDAPEAPRDPTGSAVQAGETTKYLDPSANDRIGWRNHGVGNQDVLAMVPVEADCPEVDQAVHDLIRAVRAQLALRQTP